MAYRHFPRSPSASDTSWKVAVCFTDAAMSRRITHHLAAFTPAEPINTDTWKRKVYRRAIKMTREEQEIWRATRAAVLERDNYTCYRCEKCSKNGRGLSAHHLVPRSQDGSNDMSNLITLCHSCHDIVELAGCTTLVEIDATADRPIEEAPEKPDYHREESFTRPSWHARVYGGVRS